MFSLAVELVVQRVRTRSPLVFLYKQFLGGGVYRAPQVTTTLTKNTWCTSVHLYLEIACMRHYHSKTPEGVDNLSIRYVKWCATVFIVSTRMFLRASRIRRGSRLTVYLLVFRLRSLTARVMVTFTFSLGYLGAATDGVKSRPR